jgi:glutamate synthase domain-containing protein 3
MPTDYIDLHSSTSQEAYKTIKNILNRWKRSTTSDNPKKLVEWKSLDDTHSNGVPKRLKLVRKPIDSD